MGGGDVRRWEERWWRLVPDREAVEGDFVEAGLTGWARTAALFGLLARRSWAKWRQPRPWLAMLALWPGYWLASVAVAAAAQMLTPYREPVFDGDEVAIRTARAELLARYALLPCVLAGVYAWMVGVCNRKLVGAAAGTTRWLLPLAAALALPWSNQAIHDPLERAASYAAQACLVLAAHEWGFRCAAWEVSRRSRVLTLALFWGLTVLVAGPLAFGWNGVTLAILALSWPFYFWIGEAAGGERRAG